jgi:flagellar protein FlbD
LTVSAGGAGARHPTGGSKATLHATDDNGDTATDGIEPSPTERDDVIPLTRLNGTRFGLNPDAVVRADVTPDTVLTLSDGTKYVVCESLAEVIDAIVASRGAIARRATGPLPVGDGGDDEDERLPGPVRPVAAVERDGTPDESPAHREGTRVIRLRPRKG